MLSVYAPASIGNLSVGFDALGLAIAPVSGELLGDRVGVNGGQPDDWKLQTSGAFAHALPPDQEKNIVMASCRRFEQALRASGIDCSPLAVSLQKNLPVGSGLGSSASSVVATLVALNQFYGQPFNNSELLELMAEMEGVLSGDAHLDNIAPCFLGGLRLCIPKSVRQYSLPWPQEWKVVVAWPGLSSGTRQARELLPGSYTRNTTVTHAAQLALFIHLLHLGKTREAANCLVDHLAEPHRLSCVPGLLEVRKNLARIGALATGISGSGSTVFCVTDEDEVATSVEKWMRRNYLKTEEGFAHICKVDFAGSRKI